MGIITITNTTYTEIVRKAGLGLPLTNPTPEAMAIYQQVQTQKAAASALTVSNNLAAGGSSGGSNWGGNTPSTFIPNTVQNASQSYSYSTIVGLGVVFLGLAVFSGMKRVRGK